MRRVLLRICSTRVIQAELIAILIFAILFAALLTQSETKLAQIDDKLKEIETKIAMLDYRPSTETVDFYAKTLEHAYKRAQRNSTIVPGAIVNDLDAYTG